jgi:hypothetical protein
VALVGNLVSCMRIKSESESVTINITFALIVKIHTDHEKKDE